MIKIWDVELKQLGGGKGVIFIAGRVTSNTDADVEKVVKRVLRDIGYDAGKNKIINNIGKQRFAWQIIFYTELYYFA